MNEKILPHKPKMWPENSTCKKIIRLYFLHWEVLISNEQWLDLTLENMFF